MTMGKNKGTNRTRPILHYDSAICDASWKWFGFREGLSGKRLTDNDQSFPKELSPGVNTFQDRSLGKDPMCWQNARKCQEFWWVH